MYTTAESKARVGGKESSLAGQPSRDDGLLFLYQNLRLVRTDLSDESHHETENVRYF